MFTNNTKFIIIGGIILQIVMMVCITIAAVWFSKAAILWFYLIPFFCFLMMLPDSKKKTE